MPLEITEKEMIERFVDGLKQAQSAAKILANAEMAPKPQALVDFLHAIKVSAGSAHQLAHSQENPFFLTIRDNLEKIIDLSQTIVTSSVIGSKHWSAVRDTLELLKIKGTKVAASKAMSRLDVLANLNLRQQKLNN